MSSGELLILLALALPLFSAAASYAVGRMPDVRETLMLVACVGLCIITISMFMRVGAGDAPEMVIAQPMPGLEIAFRVEPLGALFAVMASVLWAVNSLFSIGYMRGVREANQTRLHVLRAGDVRRDGRRHGGKPLHAVHFLRVVDAGDLSACDAQGQ